MAERGVAFLFRVAPLGDKVAVLIVAAEESVEVIVDGGFERLVAFGRLGLRLRGQVLFACRGGAVGLGQVAVCVQRLFAQRFQHLLAGGFQVFGGLRLFRQRALPEFLGNRLGQVLRDEAFDDLPLVVHNAVDAEVQVGDVEFKEFAQE